MPDSPAGTRAADAAGWIFTKFAPNLYTISPGFPPGPVTLAGVSLGATKEINPVTTTIRELAARQSDGVEVRLLWDAASDSVSVVVADVREGASFEVPVAPEHALDAFNHPYGYAALRGLSLLAAAEAA